MRAQIPYLARLAPQAAGRATLRPPRQLFAGDTVRAPGAAVPAAPGAAVPAAPGAAIPAAPAAAAEPAPALDILAAPPSAPAVGASGTGILAAPAGPDVPGPAKIAPHPPPAPQIEFPLAAGTAPAAPVTAGLGTHPVRPLPPGGSRPEGEAATELLPGSLEGPLWGTPVELPGTFEPVPVTGETDRRAAAAARRSPGALPSGSGRVGAADSPRGPGSGARDISVTLGRQDSAVGPNHPGGLGEVRELVPPAGSAPRSIAMLGPDPGGSHRAPNASGRARVSIGTIEVTVVPPARPVPPPTRSGLRRRCRVAGLGPPSLLAASAGAGRLRDGLRRWYGTAQG